MLFYPLLFYSQPPFPGIVGFLLPLYRCPTVRAVFGVVGGGRKGPAAQQTAFQRRPPEQRRLQPPARLVLQQYMAEEPTADGKGNALGAGYFLAVVQVQAVAAVVVTTSPFNQPHRLTALSCVHAVQGTVRPPFYGRQIFDLEHPHLLSNFGYRKATPAVSGLRGFTALFRSRTG